ncbi:MAG: hypothetical protein ACHQRM_04545 [Bacteroidia bacterium]
MSFYEFLKKDSGISPLLKPIIKPDIEKLSDEEREKLITLIRDKDYYEVNSLLKKCFSKN